MVLIVQKTIEIPQLLVDTVADVPFVVVVQVLTCRLWVGQSSSHSCRSLRKSLCLLRSLTSLSLRRGRSPWSSLFGGPSIFRSCSSLWVVNALIMQVVQVPGSLLPCRGAEASPWSRLFCGPLRFLFARRQGGRCPCYAGRAGFLCCHFPCRDAEADPQGPACSVRP